MTWGTERFYDIPFCLSEFQTWTIVQALSKWKPYATIKMLSHEGISECIKACLAIYTAQFDTDAII